MDEDAITRFLTTSSAGVETTTNLGYTFFFYGAERMLPFATIASSDNAYEQIAQLDRPGVYRLNIGLWRSLRDDVMPHAIPVGARDQTWRDHTSGA